MAYGMTFKGTLRYANEADRDASIDEALDTEEPYFRRKDFKLLSQCRVRLDYNGYSPATRWYDAMPQISRLARLACGGWIDAVYHADDEERTRVLPGGIELGGKHANRRTPPRPRVVKPKPPKVGYFLCRAIRAKNVPLPTLDDLAKAVKGHGFHAQRWEYEVPIFAPGRDESYPALLIVECDDESLGVARWYPAGKKGGRMLRALRKVLSESWGDAVTLESARKRFVRGEYSWGDGFGPKK